jgi:hypothetical protein
MTDELLTELIAAIVAARADGDGVLTLEGVHRRLEGAKLRVERVEDSGAEVGDIAAALRASKLGLSGRSTLQLRRTRDAVAAFRDREDPEAQQPYFCVVCGKHTVDAEHGVDTCVQCLAKQ